MEGLLLLIILAYTNCHMQQTHPRLRLLYMSIRVLCYLKLIGGDIVCVLSESIY